jgi:kinesin family protein C2/C3
MAALHQVDAKREVTSLRQTMDDFMQQIESALRHLPQQGSGSAPAEMAARAPPTIGNGSSSNETGNDAEQVEELRRTRHRLLVMQSEKEALQKSVESLESLGASVRRLLAARGDISGASIQDGVSQLLATVSDLENSSTSAAKTLQQRESELESQSQMSAASFDIERNALLSDISSLKSQLAQERRSASQKQADDSESAAALRSCRSELLEAQAHSGQLDKALEASTQEKATLDSEKAAAQQAHRQAIADLDGARERLEESEATRAAAEQQSSDSIAALTRDLEAARAAKASVEGEWKQQVEQMKAREKKAAQECERMFKLVQQAHEKLTTKEKDFQTKLASERARFDAEMEQQIAARMVGVQAKYEEEARGRRKLFNLVQELQGNIRVYCRVRPLLADEVSAGLEMGITFRGEHDDVVIRNPQRGQKDKVFEFEKVLKPDLEEGGAFEAVKPLVTSVVDGYNVCIFAYGQTGSGKTYTMEGPGTSSGVYYRSMQELFQLRADREAFMGMEISVNLLEIYNERVIDLLSSGGRAASDSLEIRRGPQGIFIPGLTEVPVQSADHVMEVLQHGNQQRSTAKTAMNDVSSRSHSLLVVNVVTTHRATEERAVREPAPARPGAVCSWQWRHCQLARHWGEGWVEVVLLRVCRRECVQVTPRVDG